MKKNTLNLIILLIILVGASSYTIQNDTLILEEQNEMVSFKIKGTGSKNIPVTIGIGSKPGSGACCNGLSPNSTGSYSGKVGDVVYDGKTNKIITKIYKEMQGTTINLYDYY